MNGHTELRATSQHKSHCVHRVSNFVRGQRDGAVHSTVAAKVERGEGAAEHAQATQCERAACADRK